MFRKAAVVATHGAKIAKYVSVVENPETKCFLHVGIDRYAEFCLCMCGGASWKFFLYFFIYSFKSLAHSLSIM